MSETKTELGWTVMEIMGHRRVAGLVTEVDLAGSKLLRVDVYADGEDPIATQFYGGNAIFCLTPVSEAAARQIAKLGDPAPPVARWELPRGEDLEPAAESEWED